MQWESRGTGSWAPGSDSVPEKLTVSLLQLYPYYS